MKIRDFTLLAVLGLAPFGNALPKPEARFESRAVDDTFDTVVESGDVWDYTVTFQTNGIDTSYDSVDVADLESVFEDAINNASDDDYQIIATTANDSGYELQVTLDVKPPETLGSRDRQNWVDGGARFLSALLDEQEPDQFRTVVSSENDGVEIAGFSFLLTPPTTTTPPKKL